MSIPAARAKLRDAHRQLMIAWHRANEGWDDPVSQALLRNHLEPMETTIRGALNALDSMNEVLARVHRDCRDEE